MKQFLQKHPLPCAIIVVLLIVNLVSWGALHSYQQAHPADLTLKGTFIGDGGSALGAHLVFTPEGALHRYHQGGTVEVGSYTQEGELILVKGEMGEYPILIKGERLYAWEGGERLSVYQPLADEEVYIGVEVPEG